MKQTLVGQVISRKQENSHLEYPDHTLHTLHNPYNLGPSLFHTIPWVRYAEGTATRYHKYNTERSPLVFTNPEPPPW